MEGKLSKQAALEALLFQYGEPITVERIARVISISVKACERLLEEYGNALNEKDERGLMLVRKRNKAQLVTKPELEDINQRIAREEFRQELTPAALEVLTIVAYLGPITRSTVDYIRGINSSFTLRNLLMRGLIEREKKGNAYTYQITFDFLKHLGLHSINDLPEYEQYNTLLEQFDIQESNT